MIGRAVVMSNVFEEHSISNINRASRQEPSALHMPTQDEIKSQIHPEENHRKLGEESTLFESHIAWKNKNDVDRATKTTSTEDLKNSETTNEETPL